MKSKFGNRVTPEMASVIKLARSRNIGYVPIAAHFGINQGRIADVMKKRMFPDVPPAEEMPPDFPVI